MSLFPHVCRDCVFLGSYQNNDLYFCHAHRIWKQGHFYSPKPSIIVRFGAPIYEETETALEKAKNGCFVLKESLATPLSPLAEGLRRAALQDLIQWPMPFTVDRRQK